VKEVLLKVNFKKLLKCFKKVTFDLIKCIESTEHFSATNNQDNVIKIVKLNFLKTIKPKLLNYEARIKPTNFENRKTLYWTNISYQYNKVKKQEKAINCNINEKLEKTSKKNEQLARSVSCRLLLRSIDVVSSDVARAWPCATRGDSGALWIGARVVFGSGTTSAFGVSCQTLHVVVYLALGPIVVLRTRTGCAALPQESGGKKQRTDKCQPPCLIYNRFRPISPIKAKLLYSFCARLLSLSGDIHPNPGPKSFHVHKKTNLVVMTYNIQGLKNFKKLKRFNNFVHRLQFSKNVVINLQETHLNKKEIAKLDYQWKWGSCHSSTENNSGGVSILYNTSYFDEIIRTKIDNDGRKCALYAKKNDENYYFLNVYAPNNHYDALTFYNEVETWLMEAFDFDPTINIVVSGDFNFVFNPEVDSIGRKQSNQEVKVKNTFDQIMTKFELVDTFRRINGYGGFTWGRDNPNYMRSRLDHICVSQNLSNSLLSSNVNIQPNESDHKMVYSEFEIDKVNYGPGIVKTGNITVK